MENQQVYIFIFTKDFRLSDNSALNQALSGDFPVVPIFFLDYEDYNPFQYNFLIESLIDLDKALRKRDSQLFVFDSFERSFQQLLSELEVDAVFMNKLYDENYRIFTEKIQNLMKNRGQLVEKEDRLLLPTSKEVYTTDGKAYSVFTYFYKALLERREIDKPESLRNSNFYSGSVDLGNVNLKEIKINSQKGRVKGGRRQALNCLKDLKGIKYDLRNQLDEETSNLSAYLELGCISPREVYYNSKDYFNKEVWKQFTRQLIWRDFYIRYMNYHYNQVVNGGSKTRNFDWESDDAKLEAWTRGQTGYPLVDAAMRELNKTGYCHNRGRLIASSFLVKGLLIDWQKGAEYYRSKLIDHSLALNNCNWQWTAGTQSFSQPYFRYLSPYSSKRFDPECKYIKNWVPELRDVPNETIHKLKDESTVLSDEYGYYSPIIDWQERIEEFKKRWR